jgi:hypothetical protein
MNKVLIYVSFKKGEIPNIIQIMDRLKKLDEMAIILDNGYIPRKEFELHLVCQKSDIDEVRGAFGEGRKLNFNYKRRYIKYHYKWDRQFAIKPEDTI